MLALPLIAAAAVVSSLAAEEQGSNPPPPSSPAPVSTHAPSVWTHTLRFGPSVFGAAGPAGSCGECWFPTGAFSAMGARFDYVLQKGTSHIRWHNIAALELGWGPHSQDYRFSCSPGTPDCGCYTPDCSGRYTYSGIMPALFLGTGFRVDAAPEATSAFLIEVDGTIGASIAPHLGLLGLHCAMGARVERRWEVLASVEGDVLAYAHASGSLLFGWSL